MSGQRVLALKFRENGEPILNGEEEKKVYEILSSKFSGEKLNKELKTTIFNLRLSKSILAVFGKK